MPKTGRRLERLEPQTPQSVSLHSEGTSPQANGTTPQLSTGPETASASAQAKGVLPRQEGTSSINTGLEKEEVHTNRRAEKEKGVVKSGRRRRRRIFDVSSLDDSQILSFCGVSRHALDFLVFKVQDTLEDSKSMSRKAKVFLLLARLKTATSFKVLGCYFDISESAASAFFREALNAVYEVAKENLVWLDRATVCARMPKSFKVHFKNVRAIIDCSEIECEKSGNLRQRVLTYSQYKSRHTVKFLIAVAPSGEIMFISQAYGGRATDTEITANSGFLDLLESGDVLLGDKGFPSIEQDINNSGALLVMPPFKSGDRQLSEKENREGYEIASVRVHVERAIERMKRFEALNYIKISQMKNVDEMLVIVSFLCNLQPDLIHQD